MIKHALRNRKERIELEQLIESLSKPMHKRTYDDLGGLVTLIRRVKYFRHLQLKYEEYKEIAQFLYYISLPKGAWVIENGIGTLGTNFYVILEGTVCIYVPVSENERLKVEGRGDKESCSEILPQRWLSTPEHMRHIRELGRGDSFGELALLNSEPRAATCVCKTDCHFACLEKEDYQAMLKQIEDRAFALVLDYYENLPYFSSWSRRKLATLQSFFQPKHLIRNQVLFTAGQPVNQIYIVKDGSLDLWVKIEKKRKAVKKDINHYIGPRSNEKKAIIDASRLEDNAKTTHISKPKLENVKVESCIQLLMQLSQVAQGKLIGVEEAAKENPKYGYTVICASVSATVLGIPIQKFNLHIKCNEETWSYIQEYIKLNNLEKFERMQKITDVKVERENIKKKLNNLRKKQAQYTLKLNAQQENEKPEIESRNKGNVQYTLNTLNTVVNTSGSKRERGGLEAQSGENSRPNALHLQRPLSSNIRRVLPHNYLEDKEAGESHLRSVNSLRSLTQRSQKNCSLYSNLLKDLIIRKSEGVTERESSRRYAESELFRGNYKMRRTGGESSRRSGGQSTRRSGGQSTRRSGGRSGGRWRDMRSRDLDWREILPLMENETLKHKIQIERKREKSERPRSAMKRLQSENSLQWESKSYKYQGRAFHSNTALRHPRSLSTSRPTYMPSFPINLMQSDLETNKTIVQKYVSNMNTNTFSLKAHKPKQYYMPLAATLNTKL